MFIMVSRWWSNFGSSSFWRCLMVDDAHFSFGWGLTFIQSIFIRRRSCHWLENIFGTKVHLMCNIRTKRSVKCIISCILTWCWTTINRSSIWMSFFSNMSGSWLLFNLINRWFLSISTRSRSLNRRELILGTKCDVSFDSVKIFIFVVSARIALSYR